MKQELKQYYNTFKQDFESLQKEVNFFIDSLRNEKNLNIDIANVYTREYGIKSFKSIETNYQTGRYKDNLDLLDIYDIAGIRIICHCQDDVSALTQRLRGELQQRRYLKIKVKEKGGGKKSEYPYKATHITFAKNIKKNEKTYQIFCEIQIRTVMADAWAVQNHKYLYKKQEEGDTNELTRAVSEIMNGCDTLWSLVKKRSTEHEKGYVQKPLEVIRKKSDSSLKSISPNVRIIKWFDSHKKKASKGLQNLRIKTFMEVEVQLLDSDTNINKNDLKEGARESQVRTSGWPIGVFFDHPKDAPKPDQAGIFAEISIEGRPS
ncbi:MAG: hypothetical protein OXH36_04100, partial [Bdellovibrionales bacterium]|nr:hypothetical protein [Bdellovibrionales bacterium]